jgi:hypothetical protein
VFRRIKNWWLSRRSERRCLHSRMEAWEADLNDEELKQSMRRNAASSRLVRIHAARSARMLKQLSDLLAVRAKAIESAASAEDALKSLDEARGDVKH